MARVLVSPGGLSPTMLAEIAKIAESTVSGGLSFDQTKTAALDRLRGVTTEFVYIADRIARHPSTLEETAPRATSAGATSFTPRGS
jgi:hypothetical protein